MSSTYQYIKFSIDNRVAWITFSRPPLNVFNIAMMREIGAALGECSNRELVAIVFASDSECRGFCAGVAVEEHISETVYQMLDAFHTIFRSLEQLGRPTLALVDGVALGGGSELVAACDIVIATDRSRFGQPEIKLGGEKRARELIMTGDIIDAVTALNLGLCNYVVPVAHLEQKATEILSKLREHSAVALGYTRRALDLGAGQSLDAVLKQEEDIYLHELMKTADANEGVKAFMEKRKPIWRDR
jgi:cyclohexa-1,5-dienecarbonyl-CoA hydratase